ncbi:hypothetical protein KS4_36630 [Poriferisphaera corsica]|uniref:Uncharacterized protein n=1 Tax=Poriferisphaera corsica TaxID=2528020 RepID=A0A517YZB2_9BACT|nr:hypothetical protein [Poriferisphaera corsica]QDU35580.1 hypothetical protein KS4_36630 [Poriferisphaera corsica]
MEDNRTQEALDELADLFLTGISKPATESTDEGRSVEDHYSVVDQEKHGTGDELSSTGSVVRDELKEAEKTMSVEEQIEEQVEVETTSGDSGVPQPRYGAGKSGMVKLRAKPAVKRGESMVQMGVSAPRPRTDAVGGDEQVETERQEGHEGVNRMSQLVAGVAPVSGNERREVVLGRIGGEETLEDAIEEALDKNMGEGEDVYDEEGVVEQANIAVEEKGGEDEGVMSFELAGDDSGLMDLNDASVVEEDLAHKQAQLDELHEELLRADEQAGLLEGVIKGGETVMANDEVALDQDVVEEVVDDVELVVVDEGVIEVVSGEVGDEVVLAERVDATWEDEGEIAESQEVERGSAVEGGAYVEAVYLGNLPGVSGPWLTQYAQLVAQEEGAVVVLHVDSGQIDVELVEPIDVRRRGIVAREPRRVRAIETEGMDLVGVLDELVSMGQPVRTVLVHLDEGVDEKAFERGAMIDDVTVCCGADDMAVMSVIQKLRKLGDADRLKVKDKQVGLMIMGGDEEHSRSAAAKISAQMAGEMGFDVQLAGWQKQMIPVSVSQLGSYLDTEGQWENLREFLMGLGLPAAMEREVETIEVSKEQPYDGHYAEAGPIEQLVMDEVNGGVEELVEEKVVEEVSTVPIVAQKQELEDEREDGELSNAEAAAMFAAEVKAELAGFDTEDEAGDVAVVEIDGGEPISDPVSEIDEQGLEVGQNTVSADLDIEQFVDDGDELPGRDIAEDVPAPRFERETETVFNHVRDEVIEQPREQRVRESSAMKIDQVAEVMLDDKGDADSFTLTELVMGTDGILAGGTALEAYCPKKPEVELAVDEYGGMHLLGMHDSTKGVQVSRKEQQRAIDEAELQQVVMDLLAVKQWADEHQDLLSMTQRQLRFSWDEPMQLHLFTDRADLATKLIARFDGDLKVHLLKLIEVGEDSTVFCTPLN